MEFRGPLYERVRAYVALRDKATATATVAGQASLYAMLGAHQRRLVDDESPLIAADPGRRAGKTTAFFGKAEKVARKAAGRGRRAQVFYFAPSDIQGMDIIWEELENLNRLHRLGWTPKLSDGRFEREDAVIEIFGYYTKRSVERARGRYSDLVWVDEAGLLPDWAEYFIEHVIAPTTLDFRGQIVLSGTPAPVSSGYFFDAIHSQHWSNKHHWTAEDNPHFAGRDVFAEVCQRLNLSRESVTFRREWLAEWLVDPDALVYVIPGTAIVPAPGAYHGYVTGLDLGWRDMDAISVVGIDGLRQRAHLLLCEGKSQQTNHQLFARLLELQVRFPGPVVYDPAGHATKKTIETFRSDAPTMQWIQAEKARKVEFINLLNDDMRSGFATVEPGSDMIREAKRVQWKRPGKLADDAGHSDLGDSWLYPWRYARDQLRILPEPVAEKRQLDPFEQEQALLAEDEGSYFQRRRRELSGR